jgi:hypothetical protein
MRGILQHEMPLLATVHSVVLHIPKRLLTPDVSALRGEQERSGLIAASGGTTPPDLLGQTLERLFRLNDVIGGEHRSTNRSAEKEKTNKQPHGDGGISLDFGHLPPGVAHAITLKPFERALIYMASDVFQAS